MLVCALQIEVGGFVLHLETPYRIEEGRLAPGLVIQSVRHTPVRLVARAIELTLPARELHNQPAQRF